MNDTTSDPDQADEDILLAYDVADEALEAAAGTQGGPTMDVFTPCATNCGCAGEGSMS
jgi:hypothetical protein